MERPVVRLMAHGAWSANSNLSVRAPLHWRLVMVNLFADSGKARLFWQKPGLDCLLTGFPPC